MAYYTGALLAELARLHTADEWVLFTPGRAPLPPLPGPGGARPAPAFAHAPNVTLVRHRLPGRVLFGAAALTRRPRLDRLLGSGLDVVWSPAPAPLALSPDVPFALTVHDLSFLERAADFTAYERLWHRLARPGWLMRRATRVMAVSADVAARVQARFGLPPERVAVVPPAISRPPAADLEQVRRACARLGVRGEFLLFVGALEPRKAPQLLLSALARARARGLSAQLVFAGTGRLARRLQGEGVLVLGRVAADDLDALYSAALALVLPSWGEGFGLPPLEALARGTPAVVSDLPVFDETLGHAALRFPPGDEQALAAALVQIAADAELRRRLVAAGADVLDRLSWSAAAQRTRDVLAQAAHLATATALKAKP